MKALLIILMIAILAMAVFLVVAVLFQKGKSGLSGTIAGGSSDTFFGKEKGTKSTRLWSRLTIIVSIVFVLLVIVIHVIQPDYATNTYSNTDMWKALGVYSEIFAK